MGIDPTTVYDLIAEPRFDVFKKDYRALQGCEVFLMQAPLTTITAVLALAPGATVRINAEAASDHGCALYFARGNPLLQHGECIIVRTVK